MLKYINKEGVSKFEIDDEGNVFIEGKLVEGKEFKDALNLLDETVKNKENSKDK
ncbi:hypothetical protein QO179_24350 [Bacillus stercoris]|nr:hypothetical protein [Bacillus stercoris]